MKRNYGQRIPPEWRAMSKVFTALGDEHRQRLLLLFDPGERINAGQIAEASTLSRSTVSHHLKILREANVLIAEKVGKEVWFEVNWPFLNEVLGDVSAHVAEQAAEARRCAAPTDNKSATVRRTAAKRDRGD